jgi:hypothetical protein
MSVAKVVNGEIVSGPMACPKNLLLEDGRSILGFNKMTDEQRRLFDYYPVIYPNIGRFQTYGGIYFDNDAVRYKAVFIEVDQIKQQLHEERRQKRTEKEVSGFEFDGHPIASDRDSIMRINNAATAAIISPEFYTIWECDDNFEMPLNKESMLALQLALTKHGEECHDWSKQKEAEINEAETPEQLSQIEF